MGGVRTNRGVFHEVHARYITLRHALCRNGSHFNVRTWILFRNPISGYDSIFDLFYAGNGRAKSSACSSGYSACSLEL
jgi:hypothetical protein